MLPSFMQFRSIFISVYANLFLFYLYRYPGRCNKADKMGNPKAYIFLAFINGFEQSKNEKDPFQRTNYTMLHSVHDSHECYLLQRIKTFFSRQDFSMGAARCNSMQSILNLHISVVRDMNRSLKILCSKYGKIEETESVIPRLEP